jgi:hypothetical protein
MKMQSANGSRVATRSLGSMARSRLVGQVSSIQFVAPDVAVMVASGGTIMRGKAAPACERDSIQTLVTVKRDGQWQLAAFQNTRVRPIGRNLAGTLIWLLSDWLWKVLCSRKRRNS